MYKKIKVIITGSTGMVGEGVLHECLQSEAVEEIVVINRKTCGLFHLKLREIILPDFFDLTALENQFINYDACYFCLGISSVGANKQHYYKITYSLTLLFAKFLLKTNTKLVFCYVSGAGTDSTEKGFSNWAKVKGKTENDLQKLSFKQTYSFRPAFIKPTEGLRFSNPLYRYINWLFPIARAVYPKGFCTLKELGQAMLNVTQQGFNKNIVDGKDIIKLAALSR